MAHPNAAGKVVLAPAPRPVPGRAATVRRMFGAIAHRYDLLNHVLSFNRDQAWRRRTAHRLGIGPGQRALDVCCGTGDLAALLAAGGATVIAVDFCHEMLVAAGRKLGSRVHLVEGDAMSLPFPDRSFDAVSIAFGLRNLDDFRAGLQRLGSCLKPGGLLAVLEFSRPQPGLRRRLHDAYLARVLPFVGRLVSGRRGPYEYLGASVLEFPDPGSIRALMAEVGLEPLPSESLGLGAVGLHLARRPAAVAGGA